MPREVHTPVYDESGRVVQIDVERESPWDAEQQELTAALIEYEATLNEYGVPSAEATSAEADPDNPRRTHSYRASSVIDWAAAAVEIAAKAKRDAYSGDDPYAHSRRWRVERIENVSRVEA